MNIPRITLPELTQADLNQAFTVLEHCRIDAVPAAGCYHPFFAPGGHYGPMWWQLDSTLALWGYKWADQTAAENALRNFFSLQLPDGRIPLYTPDTLPVSPHHSRQIDGVSSLPKLFRTAYDVAGRSADEGFVRRVYAMLSRYLDWWFTNRLDPATGLITAVFEETFPPYLGSAGEYAPVDTNMEVAIGCHHAFWLASHLGLEDEKALHLRRLKGLKEAVRSHLWDEEKGAYYPWSVTEGRRQHTLLASTFRPMELDFADEQQAEALVKLLTDPAVFGWDHYPLTSAAMTDPAFAITKGDYQYNASWSGGIWTLLNADAVNALLAAGREELAAELARKTLLAFRGKYTEFLSPDDGEGQGVREYAWSASQWIWLLIEVIFGVTYSRFTDTLTIEPHLPAAWRGETISLHGLILPEGSELNLDIFCDDQPGIKWKLSEQAEMNIRINGEYIRYKTEEE